MAEPTLSIARSEFEGDVGWFLGLGRGSENGDSEWSDADENRILSYVKSGLRRFYFAHNWSFLRPTVSLTLASASQTMGLPDDFDGIEGMLTLSGSDREAIGIPMVGEGIVRQKYYEYPDATGQPLVAALRPLRNMDPLTGQRWEVYVWPAADQAYTVQFTYSLSPNALTADRPYTYGGPAHAETIKEACLAAAELNHHGMLGQHEMMFQQLLAKSILMDRRMQPVLIGYNGDNSDSMRYERGRPHGYGDAVTLNGSALG